MGKRVREEDRGVPGFLDPWSQAAEGVGFAFTSGGSGAQGNSWSPRATDKAVRPALPLTAQHAGLHLHEALCLGPALLWGPLKSVFFLVSLKIISKTEYHENEYIIINPA